MNLKARYTLQWFIATWSALAILAAAVLIPVHQMPQEQVDMLKSIIIQYQVYSIPSIILFFMIVFGAKWTVENLWIPLNQLNESIRNMHTNHDYHPLPQEGLPVLKSLTKLYNEQQADLETAQQNNDKLFSESKKKLESEKNVFALLINELTEGVIITNFEGSVLLYNQAAKNLFNTITDSSEKGSSYLGLGRAINLVIETPLLEYSLKEIRDRYQTDPSSLKQNFLMKEGINLVRVEIIGILDEDKKLNGFVYVMQVLSTEFECPHKWTLFKLKEDIRAPLTNIRASVETMQDYPQMPKDKKDILMKAICNDTVTMTERLNSSEVMVQEASYVWSMQVVQCEAGLKSLSDKAQENTGLELSIQSELVDDCWVRIDNYWLIQGMLFILTQLKKTLGLEKVDGVLGSQDQFITFDLKWNNRVLDQAMLQNWLAEIIPQDTHESPITLYDILNQHDAEIWLQTHSIDSNAHNHIRLFLPKVTKGPSTPTEGTHKTGITSSKPIAYDFDIFGTSMQNHDLDDIPLSELTFTVFDTETTGLNPSNGDEVISIGGVRVVNAKMLEDEVFDELIDPERDVPPESVKIHGIKPEWLVGKPNISKVLPAFHKFVGSSVLVAHNAAFDMKFFELKQDALNLSFSTPVLDTLLLSSAINPHQVEHSIEAITKRLNITIPESARHTAVGDALVTAQIFIKFIPQLKKMKIYTLKEALELSKATYYAKIKY